MPTHKKGHDKDKYYHLAKDQGYRSRAAFKLIQINKRYDFLSKAKVCVDLCAAPGGWCQVAAKTMASGSIILGIDLLPIKAIRNVQTIVSDITTAECRNIISKELKGWKADVFLCDGAPNIGAAYAKDAYVQNELVLAALKSATDHLIAGGTFCTKVYRSADYNSLMWVFNQLFEEVQAVKPNSSRSQSSEIFVVCLKYTAPHYIDPKLLDPNHVFKEVKDPGLQKVDIFHKKYDKLNKRHRTGYDDSLGITLRSKASVSEFIAAKDPIRMLTDINQLTWTEDCKQFLDKKQTTEEIKLCLDDLRVLGKVDFKKLLKWRQHMRNYLDSLNGDLDKKKKEKVNIDERTEDEKMDEELVKLTQESNQRNRRELKNRREKAAKERIRKNLGISNNAIADEEDVELFTIPSSTRFSELEEIGDVDLETEEIEDPYYYDDDHNDDSDAANNAKLIKYEDDLENELEASYQRYVNGRKNSFLDEENRAPTAKKLRASLTKLDDDEWNDEPVSNAKNSKALDRAMKGNIEAYVKALSGKQKGSDSDSDSDDSEEDKDDDDNNNDNNDDDEDDDDDDGDKDEDGENDDDDEDEDDEDDEDEELVVKKDPLLKSKRVDGWFSNSLFNDTLKNKSSSSSLKAEDSIILDLNLPKTDKQLRKEKRKKAVERTEKKTEKRQKLLQNDENLIKFEIAPNKSKVNDDDEEMEMDEQTIKHRDLIKKGLGRSQNNQLENSKIEIVSNQEQILPFHDNRRYSDENDTYDAHDKAMTLALGTLMLRKAKQKALVDASYNRFAWNDPNDLPSWFLDDEAKHNKPQLPVPQALLDQIKSKYQFTGTREIKKVAEAKARKRKRAQSKLKTAKKHATALAENSEMSEKQKLKAISKLMRKTKDEKSPGKVYVVTRKTGSGSMGTLTKNGSKGKLKFVDKRAKKDARAAKARERKKK